MFQSESRFVTRTGQGPTTVKALNAILAQDRRAGWAIEHGEVTPGISTIAAPVYDVLSRPIAAIGLSLAEDALSGGSQPGAASADGSGIEPLVDRVLKAAAEVTAKLR